MKKLLMLIAFAVTVNIAMAQVKRTNRYKVAKDSTTVGIRPTKMRGGKQGMNQMAMAKGLGLSSEQKAKFKEMQQDNKTKKDAIQNDEKLSDTEKKEKLKELRKEQLKASDAVLTTEQKEKMKQMRQTNMKQVKNKRSTNSEEGKDL